MREKLPGLNDVKTEFSTFSSRSRRLPISRGCSVWEKKPVLGRTLMVPQQDAVNVIKWVEGIYQSRWLERHQSSVVKWIAQVHYGLFNYPIRVR